MPPSNMVSRTPDAKEQHRISHVARRPTPGPDPLRCWRHHSHARATGCAGSGGGCPVEPCAVSRQYEPPPGPLSFAISRHASSDACTCPIDLRRVVMPPFERSKGADVCMPRAWMRSGNSTECRPSPSCRLRPACSGCAGARPTACSRGTPGRSYDYRSGGCSSNAGQAGGTTSANCCRSCCWWSCCCTASAARGGGQCNWRGAGGGCGDD